MLRCQLGEQRCFSCGIVGYDHLHRERRQVRKVGALSKLSDIGRPRLVRHMLTIHESIRAALGKMSGLRLAFRPSVILLDLLHKLLLKAHDFARHAAVICLDLKTLRSLIYQRGHLVNLRCNISRL